MSIADRILRVKSSLPGQVELVAVSKTYPAQRIMEAYEAGQRIFGENRPQEMAQKYEELPKDIEWHLIGHLQTNKIKKVLGRASLIQSVDSEHLLLAIEKEAAKAGIVQDILLEVNIGGEAAKSGVDPAALPQLLETAAGCAHIRVRGLMAIPPVAETSDGNHAYFTKMHELFVDIGRKKYDNVSMDFLSMGMSGDFEDAICAGANMVRVGSSIFGARDYSRH